MSRCKLQEKMGSFTTPRYKLQLLKTQVTNFCGTFLGYLAVLQ